MEILSGNLIESLIAISLVYALLSVLVSILVEVWNKRTNARGKLLQQAIIKLLDDTANANYGQLFYNHHMIASLTRDRHEKLPQYISAETFAEVLVDIIGNQVKGQVSKGSEPGEEDSQSSTELFVKAVKEHMNAAPFQEMLASLIDKSSKEGNTELDYEKLKDALIDWYNSSMDRVTGWFKEQQQSKTLTVALLVTLFLNVDSIFLFKVISYDDDLRENLVAQAEKVSEEYENAEDTITKLEILKKSLSRNKEEDSTQIDQIVQQLSQLNGIKEADLKQYEDAKAVIDMAHDLGIPIGWDRQHAPLTWFCNKESKNAPSISDDETIDEEKKQNDGKSNGNVDEEKQGTEQSNEKPKTKEITGTDNHESSKNDLYHYVMERNESPNAWTYILYVLGLIISVYSLSFGAPFWFDTLSKLVNLRGAGIKPKTSEK